MPVAGRKPVEGPKRNRMPAVHDWHNVPDVPYAGVVPVELPESRRVVTKLRDGSIEIVDVTTSALTRSWWSAVSSMPHCALWTLTDWHFALSTAIVADLAFDGDKVAAGELRQREKIIGTTLDSRRDLRIRYVEPDVETTTQPSSSAQVASLDDRRRRSVSA